MNTPVFALDDQGFFLNNAISTMTIDDPTLLYCLMSPVAWFLLQQSAAPMANGYRQLHGHVIERLPIPEFTSEEQSYIKHWISGPDGRGGSGSPSWDPVYRAFGLSEPEIDVILKHQ